MPRNFTKFAMYGADMGQTTLYAPIYTVDPMHPEKMFNPIIEISGDAPDDVVIKDMTLDGRRKDQTAPTNAQRCYTGSGGSVGLDLCDEDILPDTCWHALVEQAAGIYNRTPSSSDIRRGGEIRNVEVKEMLGAQGIFLREAEEWTVEGNWLHNLGCHDVDAVCPNLNFFPSEDYPIPNPCWVDGTRNRWTNAAGIQIGQNCSDILVEDNIVGGGRNSEYGATKVGIATHKSFGPGCVPGSPTDITIRGNTISWSGSGAFVNGGCRVIFEKNTARHSIDSGREDETGAFGFGCTDGGEGSEWHNNTSHDNQASGFFIRCRQGGLLFKGNLSTNNCTGAQFGDFADLSFSGHEPPLPSCMVVAENQSYSPLCWAGRMITDFTDVTVTEDRVTSGTVYGLRFRDVERVEVEYTDILENSPGHEEETGIRFDGGITETYIQDTVTIDTGNIEIPIAPADQSSGCLVVPGDDVAYCDQEPGCSGEPLLDCCDNLGSSNDPLCPSYGTCYECPANASLDCGAGCQTTQPPSECPAVPTGSHGCLLQDDGLWEECDPGEEIHLVTCECEAIVPGTVCQASTFAVDCR